MGYKIINGGNIDIGVKVIPQKEITLTYDVITQLVPFTITCSYNDTVFLLRFVILSQCCIRSQLLPHNFQCKIIELCQKNA